MGRLAASAIPSAPKRAVRNTTYIFASFDLVNSTAFKSETSPNLTWPLVFKYFYDNARSEFAGKTKAPTRIWKYAGDEVLFYTALSSRRQIPKTVEVAASALSVLCSSMRNLTPFARLPLSVKATCWIAEASEAPSGDIEKLESSDRNVSFTVPLAHGRTSLDFIGPDIDIGFRVANRSGESLLTLSAELAWIVGKIDPRLGARCRVSSLHKLKGVWNDRPYPIVHYDRHWETLEKRLPYDAGDRSEPVSLALKCSRSASPFPPLEKILRDVGELDRIKRLMMIPASSQPKSESTTIMRSAAPSLEVHCVAVCLDRDGRILIAKRPKGKSILPGKWEFGCARLHAGQSFQEALRLEYHAEFGIELDFARFGAFEPIWSYSFPKEGRNVPGVIFVAFVPDPKKAGTSFNATKHTDVRWADRTAIRRISPSSAVDDFHATAALASKRAALRSLDPSNGSKQGRG